MTIQLLTQKEAIEILNRTTGSMAIKALHFDCVKHYGPMSHQIIKESIGPDLEVVSNLLASPIYSDNQFRGAAYSLHHEMGLIARCGAKAGHIAVATFCEADAIFSSKRGFGAKTIAEFTAAVELVVNAYINMGLRPLTEAELTRIESLENKHAKLQEQFDVVFALSKELPSREINLQTAVLWFEMEKIVHILAQLYANVPVSFEGTKWEGESTDELM